MLDTETKRRIESARDVLVGKVPDPKSQVEQITIAMMYKFMDDIDADAEELGAKRKFFAGDFAKYGWAKLLRSGLGGHDTLNLYGEAIARMPENPGIPPLFRDIFKNAYLPYRDPETLRGFLKIIDGFTYDHSERLGDAFEYLLAVLGAQGDAGQFRTPRHIIDFMVAMVDPQLGETVLDPACGTAGFLISSYKHIAAANRGPAGNSTLTPDQKARLARSFTGFDISPDMVRLSLVNMYLHGFQSPHIHEHDTLTSEDRWKEYADVILANPPFMTPKGGIKPHRLFSVRSKRSEVLFLDYILEHLAPDGRAGVVVPEGIHFVAQSGHHSVRRRLLEQGMLLADITLPHGVFKPYASVKTHVLVIDRRLGRQSDSVLFVEIENDGFTQSDTRDAIPGSQLAGALACVRSFQSAVRSGEPWQHPGDAVRAYTVARSTLLQPKTAHLLGRWHDLPNRVIHTPDVPLHRLGALCEIEDGLSPNMATRPGEHVMVVPAADRKTADHFDFEGRGVCIPLVSSAGHGKADIKRVHYQEGRFALATTMCALFVKDEEALDPRFLHLFLDATSQELLVPLMCGATNVTMKCKQLSEVVIPVPDPVLQAEVVQSHLLRRRSGELLETATALRDSSTDPSVVQLSERIIRDATELAERAGTKAQIADFIPSA